MPASVCVTQQPFIHSCVQFACRCRAKEEYHRRCSEVVANKQKKVAEAKAKVAAEKAAEQLRRQEVVNETRARQQAKREAAEQAAEARKLELKQEVARKEALLAERRRVKQELVDSRIREAEAFELEKSNLQATLDNELAQYGTHEHEHLSARYSTRVLRAACCVLLAACCRCRHLRPSDGQRCCCCHRTRNRIGRDTRF